LSLQLWLAAGLFAVGYVGSLPLSSSASQPQSCHLLSNTQETPCFDLLNKTEHYQIREYHGNLYWISAVSQSKDWNTAVGEGFKHNFGYISGQNAESKKIPMTAPVLASRSTRGVFVDFFLPTEFYPPPAPTSDEVKLFQVRHRLRYAVMEFGGFAHETKFQTKLQELAERLKADGVQTGPMSSAVLAQYNSPFKLFWRHNEVWLLILNEPPE